MDARTERTAGTLLVGGLVLTVLLAGLVPAFPRDVPAGTAWHALVTSGAALAHTVLGIVVLAVSAWLAVAASSRTVPVLALLGCVLAVASGAAYVAGGQGDGALTAMTVGWLVALVASTVVVVRSHRRVRAARASEPAGARTTA